MKEKTHPAVNDVDLIRNSEYVKGQNFSGVELSGIVLENKEFYECSFERCNFSKTKYTSCRFEKCSFIQSDLSLIKIYDCEFISVLFKETKMIGVDWTNMRTISMIEFRESILNHCSFYGQNLRTITMEECTVREADFEQSNLSKANCTASDFLASRFKDTDLSGADFRNAKNYDINPNFNKIKKAKFSLPEAFSLLQCFDIIVE